MNGMKEYENMYSKCYVTNIYRGTRFPYQLGVKKDNTSSKNTIGFASLDAICK